MKPEDKRKLIPLIKKENSRFKNLDHIRPGSHPQVFGAVRELGSYNFEQYCHHFTFEAHQKPWRAHLKQQVACIVHLANDCTYGQQNEFGWRLKVESEIFARFTTEVTW